MPRKTKPDEGARAVDEGPRDDRWMKESPINAKIGQCIKRERTKLGLSLDDMAATLGVEKNTAWRYEDGRIRIPAVVPLMLSVNWEVPIERFFT